jgi:hypothetical protein
MVAEGHDYDLFSSLRTHLNVDRSYSMPSLLGFNNSSICTWLQSLVLNKYPSIFTQNLQKIRGAQRVEKTIRSAKRKSEQLLETLAAKQSGVQAGILVNQDGIQISDQESQALMMMHNEAQNQHYNDNKVIKKLRKKLADQPEKTSLTPMTAPDANVVDSIIDTTLAVAELGSTIIVDTKIICSYGVLALQDMW